MSISRGVVSACVFALLACAGGCTPKEGEAGGMTSPTPVDPHENRFSWEVLPREQTIARGQSAFFTVVIHSKRNINSRVKLLASGATGASVTFIPETIPDTSNLAGMSVQTTSNTSIQPLVIVVKAVEEGFDEGVGDSVTLNVTGSEPDFTLELIPDAFELGSSEPRRITSAALKAVNGFAADVTLTFSSPTPAIFADLPKTIRVRSDLFPSLSFVVFYRLDPGTPVVRSPVRVTVTATGGNVTHTRDMTITVNGATTPGLGPPR